MMQDFPVLASPIEINLVGWVVLLGGFGCLTWREVVVIFYSYMYLNLYNITLVVKL
jgi:hypothetical protein